MQAEKKVEDLFSIKLPQCNHIINVEYQKNPKIEKICLERGNLFLGGVGSYK